MHYRCWTQGKPDKLIYLRKAKMWYLTDTCSPLDALIYEPANAETGESLSPGDVYAFAQTNKNLQTEEQWNQLSQLCCTMMEGAP